MEGVWERVREGRRKEKSECEYRSRGERKRGGEGVKEGGRREAIREKEGKGEGE